MSDSPLSLWPLWSDFYESYHRETLDSEVADSAALAACEAHLTLGMTRAPGEISVRITTPHGEDAWTRHSVIHVVMADMPFVIDSVTNYLRRQHLGLHRVTHPILNVGRDAAGYIASIGTTGMAESWAEFEIDRLLTDDDHTDVENGIREILTVVTRVTTDWSSMKAACSELAERWEHSAVSRVTESDRRQTAEMLKWLVDDHLTFLGYGYYGLSGTVLTSAPDTALGILRDRLPSARDLSEISPQARVVLDSAVPLILTKSTGKSQVHRDAYMDYIGVKEFDAQGQVIGEHRFLGLLSREAYSDSVQEIPVIRDVVDQVLAASSTVKDSHSYRDLLQFLETFPREELFYSDVDWLTVTAREAMAAQNRRTTAVFFQQDPWARFLNVYVYLPRDVYNTAVRTRIEDALHVRLEAAEVDSSVLMSDQASARLHVRVRLSRGTRIADEELLQLTATLVELSKSWSQEFAKLIIDESESDFEAAQLLSLWKDAFNPGYQSSYSPSLAIQDIKHVHAGESIFVTQSEGRFHLRIFHEEQALKLSFLLPLLTNFGLDIQDEHPYELRPHNRPSVWLHDLSFAEPHRALPGWQQALVAGVSTALKNRIENDSLLNLFVGAALSVHAYRILHAYATYVSQWLPYSIQQIHEAMVQYPQISLLISQRFYELHEPDGHAKPVTDDDMESLLRDVPNLDHDRILHALLSSVNATVRTNAFQVADEFGPAVLALKLEPIRIAHMPSPHPYREMWVEGVEVHGTHLRFGAVSRGGLRWSDRRDDLRTEIMGLVRAQVVKNAVIVPTGAKGGFFAKQLPSSSDRDAWLAAGVSAYRAFISALIDVADNLVDGEVVPPARSLCLDGSDPYLVVAADKGTATFSDYANAISQERGFWLDDAFASGGSAGYDHKAMGITARGAWESVKHHASLEGRNPETDELAFVGIGDMSGDVFGNGLLLSDSIQLVAAFDHRDIFIDPEPQPQKSHAERLRLFELPRSSWQDYDRTVLSEGGGIFSRTAKSIEISEAAARVLGTGERRVFTPQELIRAILMAPVDCLWNGGIGTYVKASTESHTAVGDKANDTIRIDANQLRCRMVGEGGNLGFTQKARIEACLHGIAMNTDAVDNSAGVDTSDHEVNLKILLASRPGLHRSERDELLVSLTDDIARLVLADNISQNELLTVAAGQAFSMLPVHERMIHAYAVQNILDIDLESLPREEELNHRRAHRQGLTKPELSVLMAYTKIQLTKELLEGSAIDGEWATEALFEYFPRGIHETWRAEILAHPLRREIIATVLSNRVVNHAGITAVYRLQEETGVDAETGVLALLASLQVSQAQQVMSDIHGAGLPWNSRLPLLFEIRRYLDRTARWFIAVRGNRLDIERDVEYYRRAIQAIRGLIKEHLQGAELDRWLRQTTEFEALGASHSLASLVAGLLDEYAALDLSELARGSQYDLERWSERYFQLSNIVGGDLILNAITELARENRWQTMARASMRADIYSVLAALTEKVLLSSLTVTEWQALHAGLLARISSVVEYVATARPADIAAISVALKMLRELVNQTDAN